MAHQDPAAPCRALAYLAAWVIIPEEGETTPIAENIVSTKQDASAGR